MEKPNGVILWQGISKLDGKTPIVCIATGLNNKSDNGKTGEMIQTWILNANVEPHVAVKTGEDASVCGGCVHRINPETGVRTCYVNLGQAPLGIYRAFKRGIYPDWSGYSAEIFRDRAVRFGAYGDPAAVPYPVWFDITQVASMWTGYTHQWRSPKFQAFRYLCQASCETYDDVNKANEKDWGTFQVVPIGGTRNPTTMSCPASTEMGKITTCVECGACNGKNGINVTILAHGATAKRYTASRVLSVL